MNAICPICHATATEHFQASPYWICPSCALWFQHPLPPKVFEASHEKDAEGGFTGHLMSEHDRQVNRDLAERLFATCLKSQPSTTLDVGSKFPFLSRCLKDLGCTAWGMDDIEIVPDYARALDVPMMLGDFERLEVDEIRSRTGHASFDLITMVHVFEHMYAPKKALAKLRALVSDHGRVFLRLPSQDVAGFERDLTPGHFTIHPFFHCLSSLLELLQQTRDLFTVEQTYELGGAGQRDLILRPATRAPTVLAGLIVKNEARDLPRCFRSLAGVVDGAIVVDTGSTDNTLAIAEELAHEVGFQTFESLTYTDASRTDEAGDWKLWNFGKARNVFVEVVEKHSPDWVFWVDADDKLMTPSALRRWLYLDQISVIAVRVYDASLRWIHHRLWRAGKGIHFEGRCHEYPTIGGHAALTRTDVVIEHDATPGGPGSEDANVRNLRILNEEWAEDPRPRVAFYLANTHKDGQRWVEAAAWYETRIAMGVDYRDEWLFAWLGKARCLRAAGNVTAAEMTLLSALSHERGWGELWMELAYIAFEQRRWHASIGYSLQAYDLTIPPTELWREVNKYTDQPPRLISWAHENLGELPAALEWAVRAMARIGTDDADWSARIDRLERATDRERSRGYGDKIARIALHRPGAIGDILMILNLLPALREVYDVDEIHFYCDEKIGQSLCTIMLEAGVDAVLDSNTLGTERATYDRVIDLIGYPLAEGYPEKPMTKHLIEYFAAELGLEVAPSELPSLMLRLPRQVIRGHYATLQVKTGWSAYKNWPVERWAEVVAALPEIPFVQIGAADEPRIPGANHSFLGTELVVAIALVANATIHCGLDSFANHLTHYTWSDANGAEGKVPGVILWGSTQVSASGYSTNRNLSLGLSCQPCFREDPTISRMSRGVCPNPLGQVYEEPRHACMNGITVAHVVEQIREAWKEHHDTDHDERGVCAVDAVDRSV